MARTIEEIQQSIIDAKNADPVLNALTNMSATARWRLMAFLFGDAGNTIEGLFDGHKMEISTIIGNLKPHSPQWYASMAKLFQYGDDLPDGSDAYAVIDPSVQIVTYAAAIELSNLLRIKVAKAAGTALAPLSGAELTAFTAYMGRIKDAGVRLNCTSAAGDTLRCSFDIFYDPLVLDNTGKRLDGTNDTPVLSAANAFLSSLPFNGVFVLNRLIDAIQAVDGVTIGQPISCQANYAATPFIDVVNIYVPDAGYLVLDAAFFNLNTIYTAYGVL